MQLKTNSISFKLFAATSLLLLLFIASIMLLQTACFENLYQARKTKKLEADLLSLKDAYLQCGSSPAAVFFDLQRFESSNNANLAILKKASGKKYLYSYPERLRSIAAIPFEPDVLQQIVPRLAALPLNEAGFKRNILIRAILNWETLSERKPNPSKHQQITLYNVNQGPSKASFIVAIMPLNSDRPTDDVLFAVASLQPAAEAASVIKEFYPYVFAAALLMLSLLFAVYYNLVSKPLIRLNQSANDMASLNIKSKYMEEGDNEFGHLAALLNAITEKYNEELINERDLKEKLELDIRNERQLEKVRRDFISDVSHELKTPISVISGYAQLLKDNFMEKEHNEVFLDIISNEAKKMDALICDLLDLAQIESGYYKLSLSEFNINELLQYTAMSFSHSMQQKNISLTIDISNTRHMVYGDKLRIGQVVSNIFSNAVRHTLNHGEIKVRLLDNSHAIVIEVENTGNQIEESELPRVWDKFYKTDKSKQLQLSGTGLGLSIVKNILILHNSTFGVENTASGVKFYFSLLKVVP